LRVQRGSQPMRAPLSACSSAADDALFHRQRVIDIVDTLPKYVDGWDGPTFDPAN